MVVHKLTHERCAGDLEIRFLCNDGRPSPLFRLRDLIQS